MTKEEKDEMRLIIHDVMVANSAKYEAELNIINYKLDEIKVQTTKHNGRMSKIEDKIYNIELREGSHITNCPQTAKISVMQKQLDATTSVKTFIWKAITIAGVAAAVIVSIIKIYESLI